MSPTRSPPTRNQPTTPTPHSLTAGDIVRLKEPYRPADFSQAKHPDWPGFTYGIVVDILSTPLSVNGEAYAISTRAMSRYTSTTLSAS
ncbi:MAG: hypothetical protein WBD47_07445 [Phormidesmis sp.]